MTSHLHRDLDALKSEVLALGGEVERATNLAISGLVRRDKAAAQEVVDGDDAIDQQELQLEEACLKALALHQPVASDLRFIIAIMKVTNDLERVGDLAANIGGAALALADRPALQPIQEIEAMAERVVRMLRDSLDALVNQNAGLARRVLDEDAAVDAMHKARFGQIQDLIRESPEDVESAIYMLSVSRYLERIADHATNIAEDVVFMAEGAIIRHRHEP